MRAELLPTSSAGSGVADLLQRPRLETLRPLVCCLTSRDYTLLEAHLWRLLEGGADADLLLARLIRTKLADARLVLSDDIEPTVATGNSHVVFTADGGREVSRVLVHWDDDAVSGPTLPIPSLPGATLLGMHVGQRAPLIRPDGSVGYVALEAVLRQPEAARRQVRTRTAGG